MAIKKFNIAWLGVYDGSSNRYVGGSNIRVGGGNSYNSFIGFPSSVRDALKTSKTTPSLKLKFNVLDGAEFDVGEHKETSNKASGTLPWYRYAGLAPIFGTGWQTIDLTSAFKDDYLYNGFHGVTLYGGSDFGEAHGITGSSNNAYIEVEGTWNTPPFTPKITTPTASTIADDLLTVKWTGEGDLESSSDGVFYHVHIRRNNSWVKVGQTASGVEEFTFSVANEAETSSARVAVRADDGELLSDALAVSQYFTISHNKPPAQPSFLEPSKGESVNRTSGVRFTWKHNDDGVQAGYRVRWRIAGTSTWSYVPAVDYANSINQYVDFSANTFSEGEIEWQATTKDQQGLVSEWSSSQKFFATIPTDAPIFVSPVNGGFTNETQPVIQWSSVGQDRYELELLNSGGSLIWSTESSTTAKSIQVGVLLDNNLSYTLRLRVLDTSKNIWSVWSEVTFTTEFTPPIIPVITALADNDNANITTTWVSDEGLTDALNGNSYVDKIATDNFVGKVAGSTVENPHIAKHNASNTSTSLYSPSAMPIEVGGSYPNLATLDGTLVTIANSTNAVQAQELFSFNLIEHVERKYGVIPASDVAGKVAWLKANIQKLICNWHGWGSSPTGNKANASIWLASSSSWGSPISHTNSTVTKIALSSTAMSMIVDSNGFVHFLAYAEASDGVTASTIRTDFVELEVTTRVTYATTEKIDLFRREFNSSEVIPWVRVGVNLDPSGTFVDMTPASDQTYEYKVRAIGENETSIDSLIAEAETVFEHAFLQRSTVLSDTIRIMTGDSREENLNFSGQLMFFANRRKPVYEFGISEEDKVSIEWIIDTPDELRVALKMVRRKETLLYRDNNGRRIWCVALSPKISDRPVQGFNFSVELSEVDFIEEVEDIAETSS